MRVHFGCANFSDEPVTVPKQLAKGTTIGKFTCVSPDDIIYDLDQGSKLAPCDDMTHNASSTSKQGLSVSESGCVNLLSPVSEYNDTI